MKSLNLTLSEEQYSQLIELSTARNEGLSKTVKNIITESYKKLSDMENQNEQCNSKPRK